MVQERPGQHGDHEHRGSREANTSSKPDPFRPSAGEHVTRLDVLVPTLGTLHEVRDDGLTLGTVQPALEMRRQLVDAQMQGVLRLV
jgi:hypothetical protein